MASSSTFNISTCREPVEHHASLRRLLSTTNLSVSTVISVLVFISFGLAYTTRSRRPYRRVVLRQQSSRLADREKVLREPVACAAGAHVRDPLAECRGVFRCFLYRRHVRSAL